MILRPLPVRVSLSLATAVVDCAVRDDEGAWLLSFDGRGWCLAAGVDPDRLVATAHRARQRGLPA